MTAGTESWVIQKYREIQFPPVPAFLLLCLVLASGCQSSPAPLDPDATQGGGQYRAAGPGTVMALADAAGAASPLLAANTDVAGDLVIAAADDTDNGGFDDDFGDDFDADFEDEMAAELDEEFAANETGDVSDPLSGYNRVMTGFNDFFFLWVLQPVAKGYRFVLPQYVRLGVGNFFDNLFFPIRVVNNLLQGKIANSGEETLRFTLNTTVGILGLWDPAEIWFGLEEHDEDFGQTLGVWGVGPGPHIVLPFLGPSNTRDMFSLLPDYYLNPVTYAGGTETQLGLKIFEEVNYTSLHIGEYENLKRDAIDLYPFLRDVYEQNRANKILE